MRGGGGSGTGDAAGPALHDALCDAPFPPAPARSDRPPRCPVEVAHLAPPRAPRFAQETIKKTDASGKLLPEMILICQNLRNNLQHPNEFLRGVTLRFLCRIHEEDILEPLVPSILACLDHRKAYVRRNAVLAVDSVAKLPKGDVLIPDAAEVIDKFLRQEEDPSARRNAFHFLINHAETRALQFLVENKARLVEWQDTMQMAGLQLVRKACRTQPAQRGTFVQASGGAGGRCIRLGSGLSFLPLALTAT